MVGPTSGGGGGGGGGPGKKKNPGTVKTNPNDWRVIFLHAVGAPATPGNLAALQAWALSESGYNSTYGTNLAGPLGYNPLAISNGAGIPTVGMVNGIVVRFGSTQAGAIATARFMQRFGYSAVINALRNDDQDALYRAVNASGWCKGCQSGHYPIGLYNMIGGGSVQGGGASFSGSSGRVPGDSSSGAATGQGSGGAGGSGDDSGGLFGSCSGSTGHGGLSIGGTQLTGNLFSTPSVGGIGCYIEQTAKLVGFTVGGSVLMLVGLGLVILPATRGKLGAAGDLIGLASGLGEAKLLSGFAGQGAAVSGEGTAATKTIAQAKRDQQRDELHAQRLAQQRAKTRVERSRARQEKLAEGSSTRLSSVEEARLKRATKRVGNRPDRMKG